MYTTKDDERKALEKIKKIVSDLGENSYLATTFNGCFELAESNIDNDFADNFKESLDLARSEIKSKDEIINQLTAERNKLENELAESKGKVLNDSDLDDIGGLIFQECVRLGNLIDSTAGTIVEYAETPESKEFRTAVNDNRAAQRALEYHNALQARVKNIR